MTVLISSPTDLDSLQQDLHQSDARPAQDGRGVPQSSLPKFSRATLAYTLNPSSSLPLSLVPADVLPPLFNVMFSWLGLTTVCLFSATGGFPTKGFCVFIIMDKARAKGNTYIWVSM